MFQFNKITQAFPLIYENNLTFKAGRSYPYYQGTKPFDDANHPQPNLQKFMTATSRRPQFHPWDLQVSPVLIEGKALRPTEEYVGVRTGLLFPMIGWVTIGSSRKLAVGFEKQLRYNKYKYLGKWLEFRMTPRWKRAPRVGPSGPRCRYRGKLSYSSISLQKIQWAIETGRLNPNEKITLYHLMEARVIAPQECVWPGLRLRAGPLDKLSYPIHLELQRASARAISLIESAGGTFTCTYMSPQGMFEEIYPEKFPVFTDQHMPDRLSFENASTNPKQRGYLADWYEENSKYAHPLAGRRQSHYVEPPVSRDFPATLEEYDRVKHHQKWHLGQPGTGTVLPWLSERSNQRPIVS